MVYSVSKPGYVCTLCAVGASATNTHACSPCCLRPADKHSLVFWGVKWKMFTINADSIFPKLCHLRTQQITGTCSRCVSLCWLSIQCTQQPTRSIKYYPQLH